MATLPPDSLLVRSRSTRSASIKQRTQPSSVVAASTTPNPTNPSHLSLFLTNLRLLDLDSYPDWPVFDPQTFNTQKKRIQAIEWALYQLFVLWDPEEAQAKLEPYFPPRDQVQSINLRAALLRCLENAKKTGLLGRDAIIRRTMLDECKGERFEEVLAVFSSAVLKKLVAAVTEAEEEYPAIAQQLALENRGYGSERTELVSLIIAHKVSLSRLLRQKNEARRRYEDLAELLDLKERNIRRRREEVGVKKRTRGRGDAPSEDYNRDVLRTVRNNWAGDERWMDALLFGDAKARQDALLSTRFDRVWRRVESNRLSELEDHGGKGMLEQLDERVKSQRESLLQWQTFQHEMFGSGTGKTPSKRKEEESGASKRGIDLGFDQHSELHRNRGSASQKTRVVPQQKLNLEYTTFLETFREDLAQVGSKPSQDVRSLLVSRSRQPMRPKPASLEITGGGAMPEEPISELSELDEEPAHEPAPTSRQPEQIPSKVRGNSLSQTKENPLVAPQPQRVTNQPPFLRRPSRGRSKASTSSEQSDEAAPIPVFSVTDADRRKSRSRSPKKLTREDPLPLVSPQEPPKPPSAGPVSPTQQLADQILESMNNASPSPVKQSKPRHTLSLAERTRMSMARMSRGGMPFDPDEDEQDLDVSAYSTTTARGKLSVKVPVKDEDVNEEEGAQEDLVSRTRKSMAGFEAARQKAQVARRRSQRQSRLAPRREGSQYPKLDEETMEVDADASVLTEQMMEKQGEDMEAIFKSRPRLQTSPAPSPGRTWDQDEFM